MPDKIRVRWLEPKRAFGRTSFVLENDIICDRAKDLLAGCIVKAKWKSSDRIFKAKLLAPLQAKCSQGKETSLLCELNGSFNSSSEEPPSAHSDSDTELENEEDDEQVSVDADDTSSTSSRQNESDDTVPEDNSEPLQRKLTPVQYAVVQELIHAIKSEMDVMRLDFRENIKEEMRKEMDAFKKDMEMEMNSVKSKYEKEIENLKQVVAKLLREVQVDVSQQVKLVVNAVSELNDIATSRDTQNHIDRHIPAVEQSDKQEHPPAGVKDGKREQAAFGLVESGYVVTYKDDKKILSIKCDRYSKMFHSARTPTSFLRKLLGETFTNEKLAKCNYSGGKVTCFNGVTKKKVLDRDRVQAIIEQVKLEFPGSAGGMEADGKLRDAVNEQCRYAARKLRLQEMYGT